MLSRTCWNSLEIVGAQEVSFYWELVDTSNCIKGSIFFRLSNGPIYFVSPWITMLCVPSPHHCLPHLGFHIPGFTQLWGKTALSHSQLQIHNHKWKTVSIPGWLNLHFWSMNCRVKSYSWVFHCMGVHTLTSHIVWESTELSSHLILLTMPATQPVL